MQATFAQIQMFEANANGNNFESKPSIQTLSTFKDITKYHLVRQHKHVSHGMYLRKTLSERKKKIALNNVPELKFMQCSHFT